MRACVCVCACALLLAHCQPNTKLCGMTYALLKESARAINSEHCRRKLVPINETVTFADTGFMRDRRRVHVCLEVLV